MAGSPPQCRRLARLLCGALLIGCGLAPAARAQSSSASACHSGVAVSAAGASLQQQPDRLDLRLKLADALVEASCYDEAVTVLEAGRQLHPQSIELANRLREVRSEIAEQNYIQRLTQAEEVARQQHARLRCTKLADLEACNEALASAPSDPTLLLAKADVLLQAGRVADSLPLYEQVTQLDPANEAAKAKLAAALARQQPSLASSSASTAPAESAPPPSVAPLAPPRRTHAASTPRPPPAVALNAGGPAPLGALASGGRRFSNEAPPGRSN